MKEKRIVRDFIRLDAYPEGSGRICIVRDDAGTEIGFEVRGMLTMFGQRNENGLTFTKGSYDRFVDSYFETNKLNVPLCLLHNDTDIRNICGYVKSMTKTEAGVELVGFVPKSAYYYNLIKDYVSRGILQGFSNCGCVADGEYDEKTNALIVKDFELLHAALVCTPADTGATLKAANTLFEGFNKKNEQPKTEDALSAVNEILPDADDFMMTL